MQQLAGRQFDCRHLLCVWNSRSQWSFYTRWNCCVYAAYSTWMVKHTHNHLWCVAVMKTQLLVATSHSDWQPHDKVNGCILIPHLHIRTSGEANSEANNECTNHIFASSFVASFTSLFVVIALEVVFEHESKGTNGENGSFVLTCTNMWIFIHIWKQFIRTETETYTCSCKWRGEAQVRTCKCGITVPDTVPQAQREHTG